MAELRWFYWYLITYLMILWRLWAVMLVVNLIPSLIYLLTPLLFGHEYWRKGLDDRRWVDLAGSIGLVVLAGVALRYGWDKDQTVYIVFGFVTLPLAVWRGRWGFFLWMALNLYWLWTGQWSWMVVNYLLRMVPTAWPTGDNEAQITRVRHLCLAGLYLGLAVLAWYGGHAAPRSATLFVAQVGSQLGLLLAACLGW